MSRRTLKAYCALKQMDEDKALAILNKNARGFLGSQINMSRKRIIIIVLVVIVVIGAGVGFFLWRWQGARH